MEVIECPLFRFNVTKRTAAPHGLRPNHADALDGYEATVPPGYRYGKRAHDFIPCWRWHHAIQTLGT